MKDVIRELSLGEIEAVAGGVTEGGCIKTLPFPTPFEPIEIIEPIELVR